MENTNNLITTLKKAYKIMELDIDKIDDPTSIYIYTEIMNRIRDLIEDVKTLQ
jgi:hypothetical protein